MSIQESEGTCQACASAAEFLGRPDDVLLFQHLTWSVDVISQAQFKAALAGLKAAAEKQPDVEDLDGGLKAWIAGALLPIFKDNFPGALLYTRNPVTSAVDGPYIKFVQGVARELRLRGEPIPISGNTITAAI